MEVSYYFTTLLKLQLHVAKREKYRIVEKMLHGGLNKELNKLKLGRKYSKNNTKYLIPVETLCIYTH